MTGDFTRDTFDPGKQRSAVRHQQGRVLLDADWNEQRDIELHGARSALRHTIGDAGGPAGASGFALSAAGGGASVAYGPGTYYVDGVRVETAGGVVPELPGTDGRYLVYLDVWERHVSAVEDPAIREVALGGPDTTGRSVVTHRVRLVPLPAGGPPPSCDDPLAAWDLIAAGSTGSLAVRVEPSSATTDPCDVPENAGYKGLENQLIRVQVHQGNFDPNAPGGIGAGAPTFVWARDNASRIGSWSPPTGLVVPVERLGPGGTDGFVAGGWVELTNDARGEAGRPGLLAQVDAVVADGLELVSQPGLAATLTALHAEGGHPLVRAWDSPGPQPLAAGTWLDLSDASGSDGIQVRFGTGRSWRSGDHWLVAARTAILPGTTDRHVDWPQDAGGNPLPLPARGPIHRVARLGFATRTGGTWGAVQCHEEFAPLTDLISFSGRGGDGQHAPPGHWLVAPLRVGASHGSIPLTGREVRFRLTEGGGGLAATAPAEDTSTEPATAIQVSTTTDADGLARVWWRLGPGSDPEPPGDRFAQGDLQEVVAELVAPDGTTSQLETRFYARAVSPLVLVAAGGDGQLGWPGETLEIAPRARVSAGSRAAAGQLVEFEVASTMDDGTALDEFTGGSIHASAGAVSTRPWPGGSRAIGAVVTTDAEGVAQVQWRLGTDVRLPVQRIFAHLLDVAGDRTGHHTIFTAHLAVADEVLWRPCERLAPYLPSPETGQLTVQDALDTFCDLFAAGAGGRLRWPDGRSEPLNISSVVSLGDLPTVVLEMPGELEAPPSAVRSTLLEVSVLPPGRTGLRQRQVVDGVVRVRRVRGRTQVEWTMSDEARAQITRVVATGELPALVTLRPALFGRSTLFTEWSGAFRLAP